MKQWQVLRTVFPEVITEVITDNFEFTDSWLTFTGQPSHQPPQLREPSKKQKASTIIRLSMLFHQSG